MRLLPFKLGTPGSHSPTIMYSYYVLFVGALHLIKLENDVDLDDLTHILCALSVCRGMIQKFI